MMIWVVFYSLVALMPLVSISRLLRHAEDDVVLSYPMNHTVIYLSSDTA